MIRVTDPGLDRKTEERLDAHQRDVDAQPTWAARVAHAESLYQRVGRGDRAPFREVHAALRGMCCGNARCMYYEDAPAGEVEHVWPKSLYPERTFHWKNLLYACGACNRPKSNRFLLFAPPGSTVEHDAARRSRGAVAAPPPDGDALLLDPRWDDPLEFLQLDLRGTFWFVPRAPQGSRAHRRAEYTVELLGLNRRDVLVEGRRLAFRHHLNALRQYVTERDPGERAVQREVIARGNHATVWAEMKRQRAAIPRLGELFSAAPEVLDW